MTLKAEMRDKLRQMKGKPLKTIRSFLAAFAILTLVPQSHAVLYWGRAYDPNLQRWIQRDPIGEAGGINLHQFVRNNPVNFIDPVGLEAGYTYHMDGRMTIGDSVPLGTTTDYLMVGTLAGLLTGGTADAFLVGGGLITSGTFGTSVTIGALSGIGGDLAVQGAKIALGNQTRLNPTELVLSGAAGGVLGGAANKIAPLLKVQCPPKVSIAPGAGYQSQTLGGKVYLGGYDPNANAVFLGDTGHPQGVFAAGGNPNAQGLAGLTVVDNGQSVVWNNASPSLNAILSGEQRAAVQAALQNAFPGRNVRYAPGLR